MTLTPAYPSFPSFRDYTFFDPQRAKDGSTEKLRDGKTELAVSRAYAHLFKVM